MADRQRRKGVQHDFPHDPRNTRKPLAASAPDTDSADDIPTIYSASFDDVCHNQHQRGRSWSISYNKQHGSSSHSLRNCIRDSGYNTDVSPARTSSSTSTPAEHFSFSFDYPERMTIKEDSVVGSPFSDAGFIPEHQPDHHDPEHHNRHNQHQQKYPGDNEDQFLHLPNSTSSSFRTSRASITYSGVAIVSTPSQLPEPSDPHASRRRPITYYDDNDHGIEGGDGDGHFASQPQQQHNRRPFLSQSAPGSHNYHDDIHFDEIQQSPSVPWGLCPEIPTDETAVEDLDTVDGRRDHISFSYRREQTWSLEEGMGIPLLPKSMSSTFQDLQGGDETESEEEEENDVMTSSEEKEIEEMVLNSKSRRYSLRKRHYSGTEEDDNDSSSSIPNVAYRFSLGNEDSACAGESDLSVQVPHSTSSPSLSRDYIDQMSPELASSIKSACRLMIGLNIETSTEREEGEEKNVSDIRRRRSLDKGLQHSSGARFLLREEEELYGEDFYTMEDNIDSLDVGIDGNDSDEDVFTFEFDDIQEYEKSQESLDGESGAQGLHSQYGHQHQSAIEDHQDSHHSHPSLQQQLHSAPATPKAPGAVPPRIVLDRPPISPSSRTGRKTKSTGSKPVTARQGRPIPAHVQLAGGARLPWDECPGLGVSQSSMSTQTPHRASTMIDEMVATPVALPSEVRGTAFMHLRRGSVDMMLRTQPAPLPDIVPFTRNRAQSAPNLHDLILRQRAQRTGRELRRLSDLFHENVVRRNSVHQEENQDQHPSSYPRMGPSYILREGVRALVFGTFRSRRDSSVDDDSFPEVENDDS